MSETKWTAGPWSMDWEHSGAEIFGADGEWVMSMIRSVEEVKANARLIASAPDLYEALNECAARIYVDEGVNSPTFQKARAALAKARGE